MRFHVLSARSGALAAGLIATVAAALLSLGSPGPARGQGQTVVADIAVAQTDSPDPVVGTQQLTYEISVRNNGPGIAVVGVLIQTPFGSDVVSAPDDCGVESDGQISCLALPALLPNGTAHFTIRTRPRQVGTITNKVSVTPLIPSLDPDISNNVSEEQTTVTPPIGPRNCRGREPTIVGDADGGVIRGTQGNDVIVGLDGNDRIRAGAGKDRICGAGGNDVIKSGAGADNIKGGAGDDDLNGAGQNDKIAGSAGSDRLKGGAGNDNFRSGAGDDRVKGGSGADRARGGAGEDNLSGAGDGDKLAGQGGDDDIHGRSGNDALTGGGGENFLDGGAGEDSCRSNGLELRCERG